MILKDLQKIKREFKSILKQKEVLDVIVFGSFVKGKFNPNDIDIAILVNKNELKFDLKKEFHISVLTINDFFIKSLPLINILLREGFSLRHNKPFSEVFRFFSKSLFVYNLKGLSNTNKVKLVNILHGKNSKGLVEEFKGKWISRQVFFVPVKNDNIFEDLFSKFKIKYEKSYVLIH